MADQRKSVREIVHSAVAGELDIPEFQRAFQWSPSKVRDLVDSLVRDYPVGSFLCWQPYGTADVEGRTTREHTGNKLWIVDGQQRTTALCIAMGRKPHWWPSDREWNRLFEKCDVMMNLRSPKDDLEFALPNPVRKKSPEWVSVRRILNTDDITDLAVRLANGLGPSGDMKLFKDVHAKTEAVRKIVDNRQIFLIIVDKEIEEVAEIFSRLNEAGTKVREADVALAQFAAANPGWVRDHFNVFLSSLEEQGYDLQPSVLVRSLLVFGGLGSRIGEAPQSFWRDRPNWDATWSRLKTSVAAVLKQLAIRGILSSDLIASKNALIPFFALQDKFGARDLVFDRAFRWFLLANRAGRYSGSAMSSIDEDIRTIRDSEAFTQAVERLLDGLGSTVGPEVAPDELLVDYRQERYMSLLLYLVAFRNGAEGWTKDTRFRIGFQREPSVLDPGFSPEWHHFFPRAVLRHAAPNEEPNAIANIAVLPARANRAFSQKPPLDYLARYEVPNACLAQQCLPTDPDLLRPENYAKFLIWRSEALATAMNNFMGNLSK